MGITIVEKFDPRKQKTKERSKVALVLSGGAISGGAFKVGGLKALNDCLINRKVTELDIYVGLSAGAFLAAPLAGGIPPEEMLASLDGKSIHFSQLSPFYLYKPNLIEFIKRPLKFIYEHLAYFPGIAADLIEATPHIKKGFVKNVLDLVKKPDYSNYEKLMMPFLKVANARRSLPQIGELLPAGLFDSSPLEKFLRQNMKKNRMSNHFRVFKKISGKSLYITAMNLDTAERVVFGPDEKNDVPISQAVEASSAIPGFYKPVRIKGIDYVDGGVRKTANIDIAVDKGADLVICYNPFRPFNNEVFIEYLREENKYFARNKRLASWGLGTVLNQVFRTLFHSRLMYAIQTYQKDVQFDRDIVLIEPKEDDSDFFTLNPLLFWNRAKAAEQGFRSVSESINRHYIHLEKVFAKHDIDFSRETITDKADKIAKSHFEDRVIMDVLEKPAGRKRRLKLVQGGN